MHWSKVYNIPAISLRFFNVYGPRSRTSGTYGAMFGVFLAQKLSGIPLTVVGDGSQTRDFTFVSDVVRAVMAAARSDVSREIFKVGTGVPVSVNRIVDLLGCEKFLFRSDLVNLIALRLISKNKDCSRMGAESFY